MGKTVEVYGFAYAIPAGTAKSFIENYTGKDSVVAVKIRQTKQRFLAIVQFTTEIASNKMVSLSQSLYYGNSYLKVRFLNDDIIPKPKSFLCDLDHIAVKFGYQLSTDRFSTLWEVTDANVKIGAAMKSWQLFFAVGSIRYRLDLSYGSIWKIELCRPRHHHWKYLLIQLQFAPKIFEIDTRSSGIFDCYFLNGSDDQWVRTIDFTPSYIGHSSSLCLQLQSNLQLPDFRSFSLYFAESDRNFSLQNGYVFSRDRRLVPIVQPPAGIEIPFNIFFRVNILVQRGYLPGASLDSNFYKLVDPCRFELSWIEHSLEKLLYLRDPCYDPCSWLVEQYNVFMRSKSPISSPSITPDEGLVFVLRVQITPSKVYFFGPEVNVSNRVLRHFKQHTENFLRVSFVDEELRQLYSTDISSRSNSSKTSLYTRILDILNNGISIGGKRFEFLAFSSSQLRENSCWMFAEADGITASSIRRWMGNFGEIRNVAKYAARLGQSFSSSTETFKVPQYDVEVIPDIKYHNGTTEYVFSDGIGKISGEFARVIARKCGFPKGTPAAFQIRYAGYKGVVAIDPGSTKKLSLRPSMRKFASENINLDVLEHSKYRPCFLNRQLITLLSSLGVPDVVFEQKQTKAIEQLNSMLSSAVTALDALDSMAPGDNMNVLKEMILCGYQPDKEPFLKMMLQTFRAAKLQDLRAKSRIFVADGRAMMGCLDETGVLQYGQVFVRASDNKDGSSFVVSGLVIVAKNPCLHPGDVRVLQAINVPALHHMLDCVVFPRRGPRPHTNECSGSDLDGDIYFVCWDTDLVPRRVHKPMDYTPPEPTRLDHEVTMEEIAEYFANYMVNDSLGVIANAHTAFADQEPKKAMSEKCLELAEKFSVAVDFPKTGVPAELPASLRVREFPDFMEKSEKPTYVSEKVIGKLFRQVREAAHGAESLEAFSLQSAIRWYDSDMEVEGYSEYLDDAFYYKNSYDYKLGNLMEYYGIKTEGEVLSGNIMRYSSGFDQRRDSEAIRVAVRSLKKEARSWFDQGDMDPHEEDAKASAWYHVTYHASYYGCYNEGLKRHHFISFPWSVYDKLVGIKKQKVLDKVRMFSQLKP